MEGAVAVLLARFLIGMHRLIRLVTETGVRAVSDIFREPVLQVSKNKKEKRKSEAVEGARFWAENETFQVWRRAAERPEPQGYAWPCCLALL